MLGGSRDAWSEVAGNYMDDVQKRILMHAEMHVEPAQAQWLLYQFRTKKAVANKLEKDAF